MIYIVLMFTDLTLVLFLHCSFYDMEVAKKTLLKFYAFQYSAPHICVNRDPKNHELMQIAKDVWVHLLVQ